MTKAGEQPTITQAIHDSLMTFWGAGRGAARCNKQAPPQVFDQEAVRLAALMDRTTSLAAQDGLVEALEELRGTGWMVAVHNDYRLCGNNYTFWLFTHPDGRWIKGEAESDLDAVDAALSAIKGDKS